MWHAFACFFFDARKQGAGAVGLPSGFVSQVVPPPFVWQRKAEANNVVGAQLLGAEITHVDQAEKINVMNKLDKRIDKQSEN